MISNREAYDDGLKFVPERKRRIIELALSADTA
jgi:hypothetical protein